MGLCPFCVDAGREVLAHALCGGRVVPTCAILVRARSHQMRSAKTYELTRRTELCCQSKNS